MNLGIPEIIILLCIITALAIFFWTLTHCLKNENLQGSEKFLWILGLLLFPVLGCLAYVTFAPSSRK
ncbi:PLDc N-terminal domain-containing protein [Pelagicoccus enzymogenes]|uniref:PLDc N-terminal domain-containing protein n=1 Tax=Pelagicoccus enzymogenes TaxID=2773457 RepID=UPI003CE4ACCB